MMVKKRGEDLEETCQKTVFPLLNKKVSLCSSVSPGSTKIVFSFFFFLPPPEPPIFHLFPLKPLMSLSSTPLLWFISFLLLNRAIMYIVECTDFNAVSRVLVNVYMQVTPLEKIHHISITSKVLLPTYNNCLYSLL